VSTRRRFVIIVSALVIIVSIGIIGYELIEGWSFVDALYMTVITLSTVGYEEVHDLSTAGRIFSTVLIVSGVGAMLYTLTTIVQYILEGGFGDILGRRRMKEKIASLKKHVILCGYGKVGHEVARVFESEGTSFIIIEMDQEAVSKAVDDGYLCIQGNATSDDVLKEAGIERARRIG